MNTAAPTKKQTAFRLNGDLLERLKAKARRENRSLNNYVERVLMSVAYDEPDEITIAAMKDAMTGKGEELDLARWDEFMASLRFSFASLRFPSVIAGCDPQSLVGRDAGSGPA